MLKWKSSFVSCECSQAGTANGCVSSLPSWLYHWVHHVFFIMIMSSLPNEISIGKKKKTLWRQCPPGLSNKWMHMHARDLLNLDCSKRAARVLLCTCTMKWEVEQEEGLHISMGKWQPLRKKISTLVAALIVWMYAEDLHSGAIVHAWTNTASLVSVGVFPLETSQTKTYSGITRGGLNPSTAMS